LRVAILDISAFLCKPEPDTNNTTEETQLHIVWMAAHLTGGF